MSMDNKSGQIQTVQYEIRASNVLYHRVLGTAGDQSNEFNSSSKQIIDKCQYVLIIY